MALDVCHMDAYTFHSMEIQKKNQKKPLFRITDIEFANSQIDDKIVGIFRFESTGPMKRGPILLVLADIESIGYVYDQFIDALNNEAEHSRNLLSGVEHDPVTRFEKIVQNLNQAIAEFLNTAQTPINWNRMNVFVIELSDDHLCMAGYGSLMNMFLQKQTDGSYRTFDLLGSLDQSSEVNPQKFFSSIICGDFKEGDILIAGSRNFERIRNELRIKERLTTLPPVTASLEIKQDLERRGIPDDFVATVITSLPPEEPAQQTLKERIGSTASILNLRKTETETTKHLGPTIAPQNADTSKGEPQAPIVGGPLGLLGKLRSLTSRQKTRDVANMVSLRGMNDGFGSWISKKRKTLMVSALLLLVGILIIGSAIKHQRAVAAEQAAWNGAYDRAKNTIERAEGEVVYSEDRARKSLAEADDILTNLDAAKDERRQAIDSLRSQTEGLRAKLRRIVKVDQPKRIFRLSDGLADGALSAPLVVKDKLIVSDRSGEKLVVIDLASQETFTINMPEQSGRVIGAGEGKTSVILMTEKRKLLAVNVDAKNVSELSLGSSEAASVTDMVVYANRLYILDPGTEQIWRHPNASGGFGAGQKYLEASSAKLNDAMSLAIDSNVYVLKRDGSVARYYGGGQDGFALTPIDPPLTNGNHLWADADNPYIIIADQTGKRVIIFTKEGKLVAQYISPAFTGPTDIAVNIKTKSLYIVDGNSIYELILP